MHFAQMGQQAQPEVITVRFLEATLCSNSVCIIVHQQALLCFVSILIHPVMHPRHILDPHSKHSPWLWYLLFSIA